mmetsp:Transcript_82691/g.145944  ORF Transcript_82691/g.145944 Transcript_82691/m.145944 type:complete len:172 (+) Transcript_82691:112-627(+)
MAVSVYLELCLLIIVVFSSLIDAVEPKTASLGLDAAGQSFAVDKDSDAVKLERPLSSPGGLQVADGYQTPDLSDTQVSLNTKKDRFLQTTSELYKSAVKAWVALEEESAAPSDEETSSMLSHVYPTRFHRYAALAVLGFILSGFFLGGVAVGFTVGAPRAKSPFSEPKSVP